MTPTDPPELIITTRTTSPTLTLIISFSGIAPPLELFADLAAIGWRPPVVPPPPKDAIDWNRPDPTTGKAFTILDYRVEAAPVVPPPGAGPRGMWTAADRAEFVVPLREVLLRHRLASHPSAAQLFDGAVIDLTDGRSAAISGSAAREAAPVFRFNRISALTTPATWSAAERALVARRQPPRLVDVPVGRDARHRGVSNEPAVERRLEIVVPASVADNVCELLHHLGLTTDVEPASDADFEMFEAARVEDTRRAEAEREFDLLQQVEVRVAVIVDEKRLHVVTAALAELQIRAVRSTPTTRRALKRFSGIVGARAVPAVRVEVCVPEVYVDLVIAKLAAAAGVDRTDDERVTVTPRPGLPRRDTRQDRVS